MPQLDMFSWFNQVITTTVVMFVFFMFLSLCFLPNTTAVVKGRNKLIQLRLVNINILNLKISSYIKDMKENLMNLLINNFIPVYGYYYPVNNNQLVSTILRNCYSVNHLNIEKAMVDAALVNLLNNDLMVQDSIMINVAELNMINNVINKRA